MPGSAAAAEGRSAEHKYGPIAGLHHSAMRVVGELDCGLLGTDGSGDTFPAVDDETLPIHVLSLVHLGLHLLHNLALEELADALAEQGRTDFMLTAAPLPVPGHRQPPRARGGPVTTPGGATPPEQGQDEYDVVCVGGGLGGLAAAVRAHDLGARVLVLERSDMVGGVAAYSGGFCWVGANHLDDGGDTLEATETYLDHVQGPDRPVDREQRRSSYLESAAQATRWFAEAGVPFSLIRGAADLYQPGPGSTRQGAGGVRGPRRRARRLEGAVAAQRLLPHRCLPRRDLPRARRRRGGPVGAARPAGGRGPADPRSRPGSGVRP